ncbi:hypothetical protein HZB02_06445 [Candidatus Woesearchaeota archaeon]|nr:hypothetical protein [Candidatus Woesearchaeota archaeon]
MRSITDIIKKCSIPVVVMSIPLFAGNVISFIGIMEANTCRIVHQCSIDNRFENYLASTQKTFGVHVGSTALAYFTYPGAHAAAEVINYQIDTRYQK